MIFILIVQIILLINYYKIIIEIIKIIAENFKE